MLVIRLSAAALLVAAASCRTAPPRASAPAGAASVWLTTGDRARTALLPVLKEALAINARLTILAAGESAGAACPTSPSRGSLVAMRLRDRLSELREEIRRAAAESGAHDVRVFGSVARGEERDGSDVDFLVDLEPGRSLLDLARLELRLERLLGRRVDVVTEASLRGPVRATALREAVRV